MKEFDKPLQTSPFIKLLRSPHSGYFYDVNRNEIIPIDDDVYTYLDKLLKDGTEDGAEETLEKVAELKENGYLSNNRVKEIKHPMTDYLEDIIGRSMRKITLQITQECNFKCSYCAYTQKNSLQRFHNCKTMSIDTATKAIDFLRNHSIDTNEVNIGFYGGEPLLEFEKLKYLTEYAENKLVGKRYRFNITTNASLLTGDKIEFLMKHKFDVLISLDGIKDINDKNRIFARNGNGTYEVVVKNLKEIYTKYPDFYKKLSINMVIDPSNEFDKLNELFESDSMFRNTNFQTTLVDDSESDSPISYSDDYITKSLYNEFLGNLAILGRGFFDSISKINKKNVTLFYDDISKMNKCFSLGDIGSPSGPCIPGERRIMVTVDGDFIVCERVSEISEPMIIGNISTGINVSKAIDLLNIAQLTNKECSQCWAIRRCGICCKYSYKNDVLDGDFKLNHCTYRKKLYYDFIEKCILMKECIINYEIKTRRV